MRQTLLTKPPTQPKSFIQKTRQQIPAFVIFVNAGGEIEEE